MKLRLPLLLLCCAPLAAFAADQPASPDHTKKLYETYCAACHATGKQNAPVTGNADDWGERLLAGIDGLLAETRKGLTNMPPKGGCTECSDADLKAIIEMMTK